MTIALCYHQLVNEKGLSDSGLTDEKFFRQIKALKLMGFFSRARHSLGVQALITFDDGYESNIRAAEILDYFGVEATFFITSGNVLSGEYFYWDSIATLKSISKFESDYLDFTKSREELILEVAGFSTAKRLRISSQLNIDALSNLNDCRSVPVKPITERNLVKLASAKQFKIGAHTKSHPSLGSNFQKEYLKQEILENREDLNKLTGYFPTEFAFPFGTPNDISGDAKQFVREIGFQHAWTTKGLSFNSKTDSFELPRLVVQNWDEKELLMNIGKTLLRTALR